MYWIEEERKGSRPALNLVVIRSEDIDISREFYELLGLRFERHKHGEGSEHFAAEEDGMVFEIYPLAGEASAGARLGFQVSDVDGLVAALDEAGHPVVSRPKDSPWGRRAVLKDPDGHSVELCELASQR